MSYGKVHDADYFGFIPTAKVLDYKSPGHAALRAFVFKRDNFTCRGCGKTIADAPKDYSGRYGLGRLEVDHVVPRCRGGTHHPSNLQTLCFHCNIKKGGRL